MADNAPLYTCLTCRLGFRAPEHQRTHYASDLHRYNAKRKVAELAPVTPEVFESKVMERRAAQKAAETAAEGPSRQWSCKPCGKTFGSKNAQEAHFASKKHKEGLARASSVAPSEVSSVLPTVPTPSSSAPAAPSSSDVAPTNDMQVDPDPVSARLAASLHLPPTSCLFCPKSFSTLEKNIAHMLFKHSFFVPDAEYLVDAEGLIKQLGEDISVGNLCIYCGAAFGGRVGGADEEEGRESTKAEEEKRARRGLEAVRKHMIDKGHCKIAWDTEDQRLALSDHYDFTASYGPEAGAEAEEEDVDMVDANSDDGNEDWEDLDAASDSSDLPPTTQSRIRYGASPYELVLPSGRRIGHRSLRYIYAQNLQPYYKEDDVIGAKTAVGLLADKVRRRKEKQSQALIPAKGAGWKDGGEGGEVIKARNKGEAKRAGMPTRLYTEQRRRMEFETKRGFKGNNQKHFRDPLLQ